MALKVLLGSLKVDPIASLHEEYGVVDKIGRNTSLDRDIASMKVHVSTLNAFDTHSSKSR